MNTGATNRSQKVNRAQLVWGEYDEFVVAKLRFSVALVEMFLLAVEDPELTSGKSCMLERRIGCHPEMKLKWSYIMEIKNSESSREVGKEEVKF